MSDGRNLDTLRVGQGAADPFSNPPESIQLDHISSNATQNTLRLSSPFSDNHGTENRLSPSVSPSASSLSQGGILALASPNDDKLEDWLRTDQESISSEKNEESLFEEPMSPQAEAATSPISTQWSRDGELTPHARNVPPRIVIDSPMAPPKAYTITDQEPNSSEDPFSDLPINGSEVPRGENDFGRQPDNRTAPSRLSYSASDFGDDSDLVLYPNVPYGRSLFLFGTNHPLRRLCFDLWSNWYLKEALDIFTIAEMIVLAIELSRSNVVDNQIIVKPVEDLWETWVLFIFFIIYTVFMVTQMIAYGAFTVRIINWDDILFWAKSKLRTLASSVLLAPKPKHGPPGIDIEQRCFFRKSWNRVEFVSIVCFWISFFISVVGHRPPSPIVRIISGLAHLRIFRLLDILKATKVVVEALKISIPLVRDALFFLAYFWLVYAIAGLRSFNSSLSRRCVWTNPLDPTETYVSENFCGGYLSPTGDIMPAIGSDGRPASRAKGFTCPAYSKCMSVGNPESGTLSFDNIFNSLEIVFIIMSQNTFSDIMYDIINAEYMVSSVFFISGIIVLNLWLVNLLVAIMATSFDIVKEKLPKYRSKFWTRRRINHSDIFSKSMKGKVYTFCQPVFLLMVVLDVIFQALWGGLWVPENSKLNFLFIWQIATTFSLLLDILFRFYVYLPQWRLFFTSLLNIVDTILAIVTIVILPFHNQKTAYGFLGFFPLLRFYRVIGSFKTARNMWLMVLGNYTIISYLTIFYFATVFLASLIAARIFRGSLLYMSEGEVATTSFFNLSNTFMAMYQISTTENWSDILFYATSSVGDGFSAACAAAFLCLWLFFSSFILMNMFIAVMTDNIASRVKNRRRLQVEWFVKRYITGSPDQWRSDVGAGILALIRKVGKLISGDNPQKRKLKAADEELQRKIISEFLMSAKEMDDDDVRSSVGFFGTSSVLLKPFSALYQSVKSLLSRHSQGYSQRKPNRGSYHESSDLDRYVSEAFTMRARAETFMIEYGDDSPQFDKSLWLFGRNNKLRLLCQRIYPSAHGIRASGVEPSKWVWYPLSTFLIAVIILMVVLSCVNTPIYQLSYSTELGKNRRSWTWFVYMDIVFLVIFMLEFIIKVIADGFHYTPNAYTHSVWNLIDLVVLIANTVTLGIEVAHGPSRFSRGLMALRALRLISMNPRSDEIFKSVFFSGLQQLLVACFIALGIIFPMTVWSKNMFSHRLESCNDNSVDALNACVGEYASSPYNWDVWAPRAVSNPYFDYDTFGHALFITFGVLSLEGWVDVLNSVTSITDVGRSPQLFSRPYNAIQPIFWNFIGTVIIMTLFIAIIVQNYSFAKGTAFMTKEQLSWKYTIRQFKSVKPALTLPSWHPGSLRFKIALHTRGHGSLVNVLQLWCLIVLTVTMCIFHAPLDFSTMTGYFVLVGIASFGFALLELLKLWANGWRAFRRAYWQWYAFLTSFILGVLTCFYRSSASTVSDLQTGFLVLVLTLWIPRARRLRNLLSMATANLWQIITLLQTWFVLYLTWAIALNQIFGLTRIGPQSSSAQNFRTVPKALILLARMSSGENWNEILSDYLVSDPYCVKKSGFYETDCGDKTMAYILFISWNIISMFIFANLFISLIYETFWPVFHRAVSKISTDEVQAFKSTWQLFDPDATGYIPYADVTALLGRSQGYFKLAIYSDDPLYSVSSILERAKGRMSRIDPYKVDYVAIQEALESLPVGHFKRKRDVYNLFCAHMKLIAEGDKGVPFNKMLKTLPLYKDFDPAKALSLKQYLKLRLVLHDVKVNMAAEILQSQWRARRSRQVTDQNNIPL